MNKNIFYFFVALIFASCNGNLNEPETAPEENDNANVSEQSDQQPEYHSGLLLGMRNQEGAKTCWIQFSDKEGNVDVLTDAFLSPQEDGFHIVQEVEASSTVDCDFVDHDGQNTTGPCGWTVSKLLITQPENYQKEFDQVKKGVQEKADAGADCNSKGGAYEFPILIGNGFVEYTKREEISACAPDGSGDRSEEDTISGIGGQTISSYVVDYADKNSIDSAYKKMAVYFTNPQGIIDTNYWAYFSKDEMSVHFSYRNGSVLMYAGSPSGMHNQNDLVQQREIGAAPDRIQSNEFPDYGNDVLNDAKKGWNYIISPVSQIYGAYDRENEEITFYTYPENQKLVVLMDLDYADIVMVEWCDETSIEKWSEQFESAKEQIKR